MPVSDEAKMAIRELGLSEYECKAYIGLIEIGAMSALSVSESTGIPYSKVYSVLRRLAKRGWIEEQRGRPSLYLPKSPSEVVKLERIRAEGKMRSWEGILLSELQPVYERRGIRERPDIWIIRGEANILAKVKEVLERTREELLIALPAISDVVVDMLGSTLFRLKEIGVRIVFLIGEDSGELHQAVPEGVKIRARRQMFGGGIIADGREAVLLLGQIRGPMLAIWSDHAELTDIAKVYFEHLWESAKEPTS